MGQTIAHLEDMIGTSNGWSHSSLIACDCFFSLAGDSTISSASPLTPSELLITLHNIEDKADMKSIIKGNIYEKYILTTHIIFS